MPDQHERIASIAWAIKTATLAAMSTTSSHVTFSPPIWEFNAPIRAQSKQAAETPSFGSAADSMQLLRSLSDLSAECHEEQNPNNARHERQ